MAVQVSEEFRVWANTFITEELGASQVKIAKESNVSRSWLQQVFSGRRAKRVEKQWLQRVKDTISRLANDHTGNDVRAAELKSQIEMHFDSLPGFSGAEQSVLWDSAQCSKYAASLFGGILEDGVPVERMEEVIDFLSASVEVYKRKKK